MLLSWLPDVQFHADNGHTLDLVITRRDTTITMRYVRVGDWLSGVRHDMSARRSAEHSRTTEEAGQVVVRVDRCGCQRERLNRQ